MVYMFQSHGPMDCVGFEQGEIPKVIEASSDCGYDFL